MGDMTRWINLSYALRTLRRSPIFTATVILSLALGIGGNAALFSVVNALFLHPAGVSRPEQVVAPRVSYQKLRLDRIDMSIPDFADVRNSRQIFATAAAASTVGMNYRGSSATRHLLGAAITWQWFDVFGVKPMFGRAFHAQDDQPGAKHVIVLSFNFWRQMFGGQQAVLGQTVELDKQPYRVVGVMPANFRWPSQADYWIPLGLSNTDYAENNRFNESYPVVARLAPGVSLQQCAGFMQVLTQRAKEGNKRLGAFAEAAQWSMGVEPVTEWASGDLRLPLLILSLSVGLVLLVACSNIAGLMLVRGSGRLREFAIRTALGAGTADLMMQTLTETFLLASGGTVLGLSSISAFLKVLLWLAPARITSGLVIEPDGHVLGFTIVTGVLAALFFGLMPAWQAARLGRRHESLKEGGRSDTEGVRRQRLRSTLVVGQVALALVLLLAAGSLLNSLKALRGSKLGFDPAGVMTAGVALPESAYGDSARRVSLFRSVLAELRTKPGVVSAAAADPVPFNGENGTGSFEIEGRPSRDGDPGPHGYRSYISPSYFAALRIPLREGRLFTESDGATSQPVVIIDENLARTYWPDKDPIGQKFRNGDKAPWATIIGVVPHMRAYDLEGGDTRGIYFRPIYQEPPSTMNFVVRALGNVAPMANVIERAVHRQDPTVAVFDSATPDERIEKLLGPQRFAVELLSVFAAVALFLAAIGLYGVISFSAKQRTKEIGIRCALGAARMQIVGTITGQGFRLLVIGLLIGSGTAAVLIHFMANRIEHASLNWETLAGAISLLGAVAILAALIPAWRASSADPIAALRDG